MARKPTAENQPRMSQNPNRPSGTGIGRPSNYFDRDRGSVDLNVDEPQVGDVQIRFNNVQGEGRIPSGDKRPANPSIGARGRKPQG
jgi:hypothetical protein